MKNFFSFFFGIIGLSTLASAQQKGSGNNSLLWKVSRADNSEVSYLFGTNHLVKSDVFNNWSHVLKALEDCHTLVEEIDTEDPGNPAIIMSFAFMKEDSISHYLSASERNKLDSLLKLIDLNLASVEHLKPMAVSSAMGVLNMQKMDTLLAKMKGETMETYFRKVAQASDKKFYHLETGAQQAEILFNFLPIDKQARELVKEYNLDNKSDATSADKMTLQLIEAYYSQNLDSIKSLLDQLLVHAEDSRKFLDALVKERNDAWIVKLTNWLPNERLFVAVGAAHLVGEDGLIQQLRKRGYTVEPVVE